MYKIFFKFFACFYRVRNVLEQIFPLKHQTIVKYCGSFKFFYAKFSQNQSKL